MVATGIEVLLELIDAAHRRGGELRLAAGGKTWITRESGVNHADSELFQGCGVDLRGFIPE
jgi:hypothetical protein